MNETMSLGRARSLWWERQGLADEATPENLARAIGITGWLRTLGGADVYIAARARAPGMTRDELDGAVMRGELRVVPAVRGCIYLVPADVVADLMALNFEPWRKQAEKELAKIGSSFAVVEDVARTVLDVLATPMTPDAIRRALPAGAIPSFGDAGKKVGLSSPLPMALRLLELDGRVERTLDGGRLDTERYLWRRAQWAVPARTDGAERSDAGARASLERVITTFLDFAGPSTLGHIAAWSGLAQRDIKPVLEAIRAEPVTIEGVGEAFAQRGDIDAAHEAFLPLGTRFLAFEDNYLVNHGVGLVTDPKHHAIEADIWGSGKPEPLGTATHISSRSIVHDGLVIGFWEVDPSAHAVVWYTFEPQKPPVVDKIEELAGEMATFLLDDVGNATCFSLDTMDLVQERAARIAKLAARARPKPAPKTKARPKPKATPRAKPEKTTKKLVAAKKTAKAGAKPKKPSRAKAKRRRA